jgi:hypothetical protein
VAEVEGLRQKIDAAKRHTFRGAFPASFRVAGSPTEHEPPSRHLRTPPAFEFPAAKSLCAAYDKQAHSPPAPQNLYRTCPSRLVQVGPDFVPLVLVLQLFWTSSDPSSSCFRRAFTLHSDGN